MIAMTHFGKVLPELVTEGSPGLEQERVRGRESYVCDLPTVCRRVRSTWWQLLAGTLAWGGCEGSPHIRLCMSLMFNKFFEILVSKNLTHT